MVRTRQHDKRSHHYNRDDAARTRIVPDTSERTAAKKCPCAQRSVSWEAATLGRMRRGWILTVAILQSNQRTSEIPSNDVPGEKCRRCSGQGVPHQQRPFCAGVPEKASWAIASRIRHRGLQPDVDRHSLSPCRSSTSFSRVLRSAACVMRADAAGAPHNVVLRYRTAL